MTRKEEIEQAMCRNKFTNFDRQVAYEFGFQKGVEYADRIMLDKICKYLYRKLENGKVLSSQLIDNLRKAME